MMSEMAPEEDSRTFKTMDELLANSHKSDKRIGNLCKYECPICKKNYESFSGVSKHARKTGHRNGGTLALTYIKKCVSHTCRRCGLSILCDLSFLKSHFRSVHKLSVGDYCTETGCVVVSKDGNEFVDKLLLERASSLVQSRKQVGNLCVFACHLCKKTFCSLYHTRHHMRSVHELDFNGEQIAHNFLQRIVAHECLLCNKLLLCETTFLRAHFVSTHKMESIKDYCQHTGCKMFDALSKQEDLPPVLGVTDQIANLCLWKCCYCQENLSCRERLKKHLRKEHKHHSRTALGGVLTKRVLHRCHFCCKNVLCDLKTMYMHYYLHHGTSGTNFYNQKSKGKKSKVNNTHQELLSKSLVSSHKVGYFCRYECQVCQTTSSSFSGMSLHLRKTGHMKDIDKPIAEKTMKECITHKCKICRKLILCDRTYLIGHMKECHGMSLAEYCKLCGCKLMKKRPELEKLQQERQNTIQTTTATTNNGWKNKTTVNIKNVGEVKGIIRECTVVLRCQ